MNSAWSLAVGNLTQLPQKPQVSRCLWCGDALPPSRYVTRSRKYCTKACQAKYQGVIDKQKYKEKKNASR